MKLFLIDDTHCWYDENKLKDNTIENQQETHIIDCFYCKFNCANLFWQQLLKTIIFSILTILHLEIHNDDSSILLLFFNRILLYRWFIKTETFETPGKNNENPTKIFFRQTSNRHLIIKEIEIWTVNFWKLIPIDDILTSALFQSTVDVPHFFNIRHYQKNQNSPPKQSPGKPKNPSSPRNKSTPRRNRHIHRSFHDSQAHIIHQPSDSNHDRSCPISRAAAPVVGEAPGTTSSVAKLRGTEPESPGLLRKAVETQSGVMITMDAVDTFDFAGPWSCELWVWMLLRVGCRVRLRVLLWVVEVNVQRGWIAVLCVGGVLGIGFLWCLRFFFYKWLHWKLNCLLWIYSWLHYFVIKRSLEDWGWELNWWFRLRKIW